MVTIVLADDHVIVRQGLRALLESNRDFAVIGEASSGLHAVKLVKRLKPSVLITDLIIPDLNGLDISQKVSEMKLDTRVILLSMYGDQAYVLNAFENRASGYVLKESCGAELIHAIKEVMANRYYISPGISDASRYSFTAMGTVLQQAQDATKEFHDKLTSREQSVLRLLMEGANIVDIASQLKINPRMAKSHQVNSMRKLNLSTHKDLIRYAVKRGGFAISMQKPIRGDPKPN